MTAHKHAEMIKAKADNMDLVVFGRYESKLTQWEVVSYQHLIGHENYGHFLCLPQHKEACLHWLNGGEVQVSFPHVGIKFGGYTCCTDGWDEDLSWMDENAVFRIKPRKEKRWICITPELEIEDGTLYESYKDANENSPGYKQIVEIEVEI